MTTPTRGSRCRLNRNTRIVADLEELRKTHKTFTVQDIAKKSNNLSNGIGNVLRFCKGVEHVGRGQWQFTGEPIEVAL